MSLNFASSWSDPSLLASLLFIPLLLLSIRKAISKNTKLPPSPRKLPFIGNLHQLGSLPHRSLHALSKKHGPLMLLQLGQVPTLVISSSNVARDIMKAHDAIFASRPPIKVARILLFGGLNLSFAPYGEYWKKLKKLYVNHLMSPKTVQSFLCVREEAVASMISKISMASSSRGLLDVTDVLNSFAMKIICRATLGKSYTEEKNKLFCELTKENITILGKLCVEDCFPWLGWLDMFFGLERRARKNSKRWEAVFDQVIDEHASRLKDMDYVPENKDFVDVLLNLVNDPSVDLDINRDLIKILMMVLI